MTAGEENITRAFCGGIGDRAARVMSVSPVPRVSGGTGLAGSRVRRRVYR